MTEATPSTQTEADNGLAARAAAARLLEAAVSRRNGLDEAAGAAEFRALSARDRGFARALVLTALRRLRSIDAALDARLKSPPPGAVRTLLRLGAAQLWRMEVPDWAAVNTAVALAGGRRETERFKGLVNAVLRAVGRDGEPPVETYAPDWLHQRWRAAYGEAAALAIGAVIPQEPPTDLTGAGDAAELAGALDGRVLPTGSIRTGLRGEVAVWPRYADGDWWVQDAAAALPARLLDVRAGETALDLCAAPGGKTMQLASAGARVTALDRSAARLRRLRENLARTGLEAEAVVADATAWDDPREFDAVLLDAPCTATGTFRRHPDVLGGARPGDVAPLAAAKA